ncbi:hypothetical protein Tco_0822665 [Tanacetum coccineum]|uniref:CCHC-type domain-containing protein n=1 Tax=Tanacetum coccineum TaxID=301880 RepID=A0ABQ5AGR4_9ASTR
MASHRSKSLYAIKECSTCGSLYTKDCCSIGSLNDKILVSESDSSPRCARCGTPVDGPSCRGCAFLRKKFDEDLLAYCVENGIFKDFQDTSESSDDNTNVVNALREPCVVNQDPGEKSSQEPPQIDHNCCYECGDSLDGIFCRQCICKSCGKGAHYGYNCPPKVPIISNPEQCNQTINELPQILPIVHPTCNYEAENSFAYDPNPNSFDNSPKFSYQPPQPQFETYLCELCGNDSHYGYDCPPQFPFVYEPEPCYNQNFSDNYYPQNSPSFSQQYLCCAYCGGPHFDYQCQPINETCYEPNPSYDYSGFDHPQPPQDSVDCQEALDKILKELEELKRDQRMLKELKKQIAEEQTVKENMSIEEMMHEQQLVDRKIKEITNDLGIRRFRGEEIDEEYERICEITIRKLKQDFNIWGSEVRKKEKAYEDEKYAAACRYMLSVTCDDEDDYIPSGDIIARYSTSKAITPDLPIEEPDNSLKMGDEHLDTIPATESDEVIKSSVENLVPIPSEFEGISDDTCDVPNCDNNRVNIESELVKSLSNRDTSIVHSSKIDSILKEFAGELAHIAPIPPRIVEANFDPIDNTSSDDNSYEDIKYVDATPPYSELIEALNDKPTLSSFSFSDHTEETRSGSTTTHANYSFPEYDSFLFEIEPGQEGLISIDNSNNTLLAFPEFKSFHFYPSVPRPPPEPPDVEICLHFEPDVSVINNFNELNDDQRGSEINFSEDDDSFTFSIRTFLPFLTYPEVSPLSCSTRSEDIIFDPDIFN